MENFFLNKRHKHFLTFNVRHIFPPRVSFSSYITKCLAKIVQIHNVSGTGSDFTLPDFRSSWDAFDAVPCPHSLRCVAYSPPTSYLDTQPAGFHIFQQAYSRPFITIHLQLLSWINTRQVDWFHFHISWRDQHSTLPTQIQMKIYLNDGKNFRAMEWSKVFVTVPLLLNGLWFWKVNHCHWMNV